MAAHDALTGLPNRSKLAGILTASCSRTRRQGGRLAVLFIDLDNFKHVNDSLGHTAGDLLLKMVAGRLRSCLGALDTVARLSGDEFAVLAIDRSQGRCFERFADLIIEAIEAPFEIEGDPILIGTSIGVAHLDDQETSADQLMVHADLALYEAKNAGRGQYRIFRPPMLQRVRARSELNTALRHALKKGEFELYFQPIVSLESFRPTAIECLLRWHDPHHGLRSPRDFLMSIERSNLILAVSDWVMQSAAEHAASWHRQGYLLPPVAVNLPTVMLETDHAIDRIAAHLAAAGRRPGDWIIEVTEGAFAAGPRASDTLGALRDLGAKIAIDDFGTGYSSMARLGALPVDQLKIDQSFLRQLGSTRRVRAVLEAMNALAASFDLETVIEGVETAEQLQILRSFGRCSAQGYLFARPMPADAMVDWFVDWEQQTHHAAAYCG
jgi:diguanylate cyclase (GGDEF)-like protein